VGSLPALPDLPVLGSPSGAVPAVGQPAVDGEGAPLGAADDLPIFQSVGGLL
jgi:hypothetical protein